MIVSLVKSIVLDSHLKHNHVLSMIYLISTKKVGLSFSKEMVSLLITNLFGAKEPNLQKTKMLIKIKKMIRMMKIMKQMKKEKKELKVMLTLVQA